MPSELPHMQSLAIFLSEQKGGWCDTAIWTISMFQLVRADDVDRDHNRSNFTWFRIKQRLGTARSESRSSTRREREQRENRAGYSRSLSSSSSSSSRIPFKAFSITVAPSPTRWIPIAWDFSVSARCSLARSRTCYPETCSVYDVA
jgi:hypothetical protein